MSAFGDNSKGAFSYCTWESPGKNTGVVCLSLLHRTTFCQVVREHQPLNGQEFEKTPERVKRLGSLTCYGPPGRKVVHDLVIEQQEAFRVQLVGALDFNFLICKMEQPSPAGGIQGTTQSPTGVNAAIQLGLGGGGAERRENRVVCRKCLRARRGDRRRRRECES